MENTIFNIVENEQKVRSKLFSKHNAHNFFKTTSTFHCHKFIDICKSLSISYDGMPNDNAHIRSSYCMNEKQRI